MTRFLGLLLLAVLTSVLPAAADAETVRAMSWNLMDMDIFDGGGSGRVPWQRAAEEDIARVLREVDPDIVFIAEAPSFVELEYFIQAHGLDYRVSEVRQQAGRRDFADAMALLTKRMPARPELVTPPVPGSDRGEGPHDVSRGWKDVVQRPTEGNRPPVVSE